MRGIKKNIFAESPGVAGVVVTVMVLSVTVGVIAFVVVIVGVWVVGG